MPAGITKTNDIKYLGEYVDDVFKLINDLPLNDQAAVVEGVKNLFILRESQAFLEWTEPLVNLPDGRKHSHHEVLVAERREAQNVSR